MTVSEEISKRLQEFTRTLESGKPIKAMRIHIEDTPDGPLHTRQEVYLMANETCTTCGGSLEEGYYPFPNPYKNYWPAYYCTCLVCLESFDRRTWKLSDKKTPEEF